MGGSSISSTQMQCCSGSRNHLTVSVELYGAGGAKGSWSVWVPELELFQTQVRTCQAK
jgi:hypothetical protein